MHPIRMSLLVALLAFALAPVRCWIIETSAGEFIPGDTNPHWLVCRQTSALGKEHRIDTIEKIRINKYDSRDSMTPIAEINENNRVHILLAEVNFTVTGDILNDTSKFLRLTWSEVDVDDAGRYGCEVEGFDVLGNAVIFKLKPMEIKVKELTIAFVKQLIQAIKDEYDVTHKRLQSEIENNTRIQSEIEKKNNNLQSEMKTKINRLESEIENNTRIQSEREKKNNNLQSEMGKKINRLESEIKNNTRIQSEMEKKFNSELANLTSLINGCQCQPPTEPPTSPATTLPTTTPPVVTTTLPTTTPPVITSKPTTKTTPKTADDQWPVGNYSMVGPKYPCPASHNGDFGNKWCNVRANFRAVIASTNETICYCSVIVHKSSRPTWPKGSYCLFYYHSASQTEVCPSSFELLPFEGLVYGSFPLCCRSDGSSTQEINLPTNNPFYLFTSKDNQCQQVKGMKVTQTSEVYDTKIGDKYKEVKRIVRKSPELCYYEQK